MKGKLWVLSFFLSSFLSGYRLDVSNAFFLLLFSSFLLSLFGE